MARKMKQPTRVRTMQDLLAFLDLSKIPWEKRKSGHLCVHTATGPYFMGSTPSDKRAVLNARSCLRRKGVPVP